MYNSSSSFQQLKLCIFRHFLCHIYEIWGLDLHISPKRKSSFSFWTKGWNLVAMLMDRVWHAIFVSIFSKFIFWLVLEKKGKTKLISLIHWLSCTSFFFFFWQRKQGLALFSLILIVYFLYTEFENHDMEMRNLIKQSQQRTHVVPSEVSLRRVTLTSKDDY